MIESLTNVFSTTLGATALGVVVPPLLPFTTAYAGWVALVEADRAAGTAVLGDGSEPSLVAEVRSEGEQFVDYAIDRAGDEAAEVLPNGYAVGAGAVLTVGALAVAGGVAADLFLFRGAATQTAIGVVTDWVRG